MLIFDVHGTGSSKCYDFVCTVCSFSKHWPDLGLAEVGDLVGFCFAHIHPEAGGPLADYLHTKEKFTDKKKQS